VSKLLRETMIVECLRCVKVTYRERGYSVNEKNDPDAKSYSLKEDISGIKGMCHYINPFCSTVGRGWQFFPAVLKRPQSSDVKERITVSKKKIIEKGNNN
jgi:hypothetical protein